MRQVVLMGTQQSQHLSDDLLPSVRSMALTLSQVIVIGDGCECSDFTDTTHQHYFQLVNVGKGVQQCSQVGAGASDFSQTSQLTLTETFDCRQ